MVAQVQLVGGDTVELSLAKRLAKRSKTTLLHLRLVERMFEMQTCPGGIRMGSEVSFDAGEVIGRATAVSVVTDNQPVLRPANVGQAPQRLVHANLSCQANTGMTVGQVGEVQQVNRQPVAAASRQPRFRLAKRQSILFVNGLGMSSGGVDDDDDLRLAKRGGALGQVLQHPEKVRFIVAGDDDNHAKAGIRGGVNLPGCCGLVEVSFVRRNHRTGGAMCR